MRKANVPRCVGPNCRAQVADDLGFLDREETPRPFGRRLEVAPDRVAERGVLVAPLGDRREIACDLELLGCAGREDPHFDHVGRG